MPLSKSTWSTLGLLGLSYLSAAVTTAHPNTNTNTNADGNDNFSSSSSIYDDHGLLLSFGPSEAYDFGPGNYARTMTRDAPSDKLSVANDFFQQQGYGEQDYQIVQEMYSSDLQVTHYYAQLQHDGLPVVNGHMSVNIDEGGQVVSASMLRSDTTAKPQSGQCAARLNTNTSQRSSTSGSDAEPATPVDPQAALQAFADYVQRPDWAQGVNTSAALQSGNPGGLRSADQATSNSAPADAPIMGDALHTVEAAALRLDDGTFIKGRKIRARVDDNEVESFVSDTDGKVRALYNNAKSFTPSRYRVLPYNVDMDPQQDLREWVEEPGADDPLFPQGWQTMGDQRFSDTQGNYVVVQSHRDVSIDWKQAQRPQGDDQGQFDFPLDLSSDPSSYSDASATQAFYLGNLFSGFAKAYGFDAASGNFQGTHTAEDNAGNGVAGDRVIIYVQDGKGFNNANFATPADGQSPVMKMYIWNKTKPSRDGAFETPIFVHEFTHGVTSRLTGGRAASNCLTQGVAAGMGEGWSDIIALNWRLRAGDENGRNAHGQPDRPLGIGTYGNGGNTVRPYIYTTNVDQNPLQFGHLSDARFKTVHNIGTIWTTMLYEILWNYIAQHGLEPDFIRNPTSTKGNTMFMRMLFASWKLQPCSPDFLQARSAMLQADKRLHQEQNKCLIWRGFAKRGMGEDATYSSSGVVESDKVPSDCE